MQSDPHGVVTLDVCDSGKGFSRIPLMPAAPYSESGRGLYIVAQLGTQLTSSRLTRGNKVSVVLPIVAKRGHIHMVEEQQTFADEVRTEAREENQSPSSAEGRE